MTFYELSAVGSIGLTAISKQMYDLLALSKTSAPFGPLRLVPRMAAQAADQQTPIKVRSLGRNPLALAT